MQNSKFPKGIEVAVSCLVVNKNNEILLSKHPSWHDGKKWVLHGGHIESGETIFAAAERETKEETGVAAKAMWIIDSGDNIISEKQKHYVWFCCLLETYDETAVVGEELTEAKWFSRGEILKQNIEPGFRKMIEKYLS